MGFTAGVFTPPSGELDHSKTVQILHYEHILADGRFVFIWCFMYIYVLYTGSASLNKCLPKSGGTDGRCTPYLASSCKQSTCLSKWGSRVALNCLDLHRVKLLVIFVRLEAIVNGTYIEGFLHKASQIGFCHICLAPLRTQTSSWHWREPLEALPCGRLLQSPPGSSRSTNRSLSIGTDEQSAVPLQTLLMRVTYLLKSWSTLQDFWMLCTSAALINSSS